MGVKVPPDSGAAVARELAQGVREGKPSTQAEDLQNAGQVQILKFRGVYAWVLIGALVGQLIVADVVFILYACLGVGWNISQPIIGAWLGAAVVQVIGVVLVVTRSLFPGAQTLSPRA
jgi:hypothetical protein